MNHWLLLLLCVGAVAIDTPNDGASSILAPETFLTFGGSLMNLEINDRKVKVNDKRRQNRRTRTKQLGTAQSLDVGMDFGVVYRTLGDNEDKDDQLVSRRSMLRGGGGNNRHLEIQSDWFDWEIQMEPGYPIIETDDFGVDSNPDNSTIGQNSEDVFFLFNYTGTLAENKILEVTLLNVDCIGEGDENAFFVYDSVNEDSKELEVRVKANLEKISDTVHWQALDMGKAEMHFCIRVDYAYLDTKTGEKTSYDFYESKIRVGVDLLADFALGPVLTDRRAGDASEATAETGCDVYAYFCDENFTDIGQPTFNQGDILVGCLAVLPEQQAGCSVHHIRDMDLYQNQGEPDEIHDAIIENNVIDSLTSVECCGGTCQFKRPIPSKYFANPNPDPLFLVGAAILDFRPTITTMERSILSSFYTNTGGEGWSGSDGWLRGCACDWYGVTCDEDRYYVKELRLPSNGISGELPSAFGDLRMLEIIELPSNSLGPSIPGTIGKLNLLELNLEYNRFVAVPTEIGKLTGLTELKLRNNLISTALPTELSQLVNLATIELENNQIPAIPDYFGTAFRDLEVLRISHNSCQGAVPESIKQLTLLKSLDFSYNSLTSLPDGFFAALSNLETINLSYNAFVHIPDGIGGNPVHKLTQIFMQHNALAKIPSTLGQVTSLEHIDVSFNQLMSLVTELGELTNLKVLNAANNQVSSTIPTEWANMASLQELHLQNNKIDMEFPNHLKVLDSLSILDLSTNNLHGSLPDTMDDFVALEYLNIANNDLTGTIGDFSLLNSLRIFNANYNQLTGTLPSTITALPLLNTLELESNLLTGTINTALANLPMLSSLNMASNQLHGEIPLVLTSVSSLRVLKLSSNNLIGTLPTQLGLLTNLNVLGLSSNTLTGTIPSHLGLLRSLNTLSMSANSIEGQLPQELTGIYPMTQLELDNNNLSGPLLSGLSQSQGMQVLRLSSNSFTGTIPSSWGAWRYLRILTLENNDLGGAMPSDICALRQRQSFNGIPEWPQYIVSVLTSDCNSEVSCSQPDCCTSCY